jgi:diaminopimelate decarboxylase
VSARYARLAARHGTPLYVYDLAEAEAARDELLAALPEECELYYALKANPHPGLVRALRGDGGGTGEGTGGGRGCRAEISSTGELAAALAAGFTGADCLYTGPGKTDTELREAIGLGVRLFSTDSVTDLRRVGAAASAHGVTVDCLLRVNSASASAATSIRMTGTPSQFGFDSETLAETLPLLRAVAGVELAGLHFFPLSNARDEESLIGEFRHTVELAAGLSAELGLPLRMLDLGGGFSSPYGVPGARGSYPKLRQELSLVLDRHLPGWREGAPAIAFESGRFLAGASGTLVASVTNVKVSRGRTFVILDAGINTFGGMSGLGRLMPVSVRLCGESDDSNDGGDGGASTVPANTASPNTMTASLAGPLCTPGDLLGREIPLPALEPGDLIEVPNAGAYGPTASLLLFLGRPAPLEILVRGDETVSVSRIEPHRRHLVPAADCDG